MESCLRTAMVRVEQLEDEVIAARERAHAPGEGELLVAGELTHLHACEIRGRYEGARVGDCMRGGWAEGGVAHARVVVLEPSYEVRRVHGEAVGIELACHTTSHTVHTRQ